MRARALLLVVCLAGLVVPALATADPARCATIRTEGAWTTVPAPELPQRPVDTVRPVNPDSDRELRISAYAVRGDHLYVTNGVGALESRDAGCTWQPVFVPPLAPTPEVPFNVQSDTIVDVLAPAGAARLHLLVQSAGSGRPAVLTSADGRAPYRVSTAGLPPTSDACAVTASAPMPCRLLAAPGDADRLYLTLPGPAPLVRNGRLYASDDAGATWYARPNPDAEGDAAALPSTRFEQLAIDPSDPDRLWALVEDVLWRSPDAGRTWSRADDRDGVRDLSLLDVASRPGAPPRVRTFQPAAFGGDPGVLESRDGGEQFQLRPALDLLGSLTSVAHGADLDELVVTTENDPARNVYVYVAARDLWVPVNTLGERGAGLRDVQATGARPDYWFRGPAGLARLDLDEVGSVQVVLPEPPARIDVPPLRAPLPATLTPDDAIIDLAAGETRELRYDLDLPPRPTPLDVFFLLDSSGSMADDIRGLADGTAQIVRELAARRIDLRVGLGDFRSTDVRYRRLHQLSRPNEQFVRTLYGLDTGGGDETHYTALHQMATGSGVSPVLQGRPVRRGLQADFRSGALRFVVHVTDEPLQLDESGPTPLAAQNALVDNQIRHIGLAASVDDVEDAVRDASTIKQQMRVLSSATGAFAPPGGVDCDGNGTRELPEGEPLVCSVPETGGNPDLATPIIDILTSLVDEAAVGLRVDDGGAGTAGAVRPLQPVAAVDVAEPQALAFSVPVTCTSELAGRPLPVQVTATVRGASVTSTGLTVRCAVPAAWAPPQGVAPIPPAGPDARPGLLVPPLPAVPPLLLVPAPAPAPAGAQAPAAAGAGSSVTGAVGQPGAQAAVGDQEERQVQLAGALPDAERGPATDLAFSLRLAGAALLTAGTAWGVRRRSSPASVRLR